LTEAGYQNVVAVRSPEAGEALARGIGKAVGYRQTAVCLLEPDTIVVSLVNTEDEEVQTVQHPENATGNGLTRWLSDVFDRHDWTPECLIIVGPDAGLSEFTPRLERALGIPVFAPAEAEFALARGAALASAQGPDAALAIPSSTSRGRRPRSISHITALTMLVGGTTTFVASLCLAAGLKLTPTSSETHTTTPPAATPAEPATLAVPPVSALPSVAPLPVEVAAVPEPPPETAAPEDAQQAVANPPEDAPAPDQAPVDGAPADALPPSAPEPPAPDASVPPTVPAADGSKPPLLTRVLSHVPGLHPDPQPPAAQNPAPAPAPPDGAPPSP
jgi:hypothetical protein